MNTDTETGTADRVDAGLDAADPRSGGDSGTDPGESSATVDPSERRTTVISRTVTRVVVPIIIVASVALLLQGHNLPGGGFIGAVLTTTAFVLVYVVFGLEFLQTQIFDASVDDRETHDLVSGYRWLFAVGLALAATAGLVPLVVGAPFLTQGVLFLEHLPLYGEFEVASAVAFDLGVYFTVVGGLLTILGEVGNE